MVLFREEQSKKIKQKMKLLHKAHQYLEKVKTWHLFVLLLIFLPLSAYFLRQNNLKMIELREAVIQIDKETKDISKIEPALLELRNHVLSHMNTSMAGPVELPGSYDVAVKKAQVEAEKAGRVNAKIYKKAQAKCENAAIPLTVRAQCIQDYVLSHSESGRLVEAIDFPPKEQFSYNFTSPRWSADLAGLSVAICFGLIITIFTKVVLQRVVPLLAKEIIDDPLE